MENMNLDIMSLKVPYSKIHGAIEIDLIEIPLKDGSVLKFYSHRTRTDYGIMDAIEDIYLVIEDDCLANKTIRNLKDEVPMVFQTKSDDKVFIRYKDMKNPRISLGEKLTITVERFFIGSNEFTVEDLNAIEFSIEEEILKNKTISLLNGCKYTQVKSFSKVSATDNYLDIHLYMYTSFDYPSPNTNALFGLGISGTAFRWDDFLNGKELEIQHLYKLVFKNDDYKSDADFFLNTFRGVEYLLKKDKSKSVNNNKFLEIYELTSRFENQISFPLDTYFSQKNLSDWNFLYSSMVVSFRNYFAHTEEIQDDCLEETWIPHVSHLFLSLFLYLLYSRWGIPEIYLRCTTKPTSTFGLKFIEEYLLLYRSKKYDSTEESVIESIKTEVYLNLTPALRKKMKLNNKNYAEKILVEETTNSYESYILKDSKKYYLNSIKIN